MHAKLHTEEYYTKGGTRIREGGKRYRMTDLQDIQRMLAPLSEQ